jgi:hypothetical protein
MKCSIQAVLAAAVAAVVALSSCGTDDPARVGRPPVVESFDPTARYIDAFVGDTLRFHIRASDPDRDNLEISFLVDDEWVANGEFWDFAIEDTGLVSIRARVTDGAHTSFIDWQVESAIPVNFPPVIETTLPVEPNPILVIGNVMNFAVIASDPERLPLSYTFTVNDSIVLNERQFIYHAGSVGMKRVRVVVSDGNSAVTHEWQLKVTTIPDDIPPAPVMITRAETGVSPGEINLEWTAVGRDGMIGKPSLYEVRTSPVPILTEADWARGSNRPNVPAPADAGETMAMVVGGLPPARPTYLAVRAMDDFGNISAIQAPVLAVTRGMRFGGRVVDTVTWQGIPNATVLFGNESRVTDSNGIYEFTEQGNGDGVIFARDESGVEVGGYFDYNKPYTVAHLDVVNMYLIPNYAMKTTYYTDFLALFRGMTDRQGIPYPADQRRRDLPTPLYCRPFEKDGLDYAATIHDVSQEFANLLFGTHAFVPASDPLPDVRVETTYNGIIFADRYSILEWTNDYYPLSGLIEFRVHYTPSVVEPFKQIIRHELGHALGLQHSIDPKHLMVGFQAASVPTFTDDEVAVLRTYYAIPRGWDVRRYQRD